MSLTVQQKVTLRAMRMIRFVRLRLRTSELVEALETTSRAVARKGASSAAARAGQMTKLIIECFIRGKYH